MNKVLPIVFFLISFAFPLFAEDGDSENIDVVSSLHFWDTATEVLVNGNYLYVVSYESGVRIVDYSEPSNPVEISFCKGLGAIDIEISDGLLFILNDSGFLDIFDISYPENPQILSSPYICSSPARLAVSGSYLYVVDTHALTRIIDISVPEVVSEVGQLSLNFIYMNDMKVQNNILAIAGHSGPPHNVATLQLYSISTPNIPVFEGYVELENFTLDLTFSGNRIVTSGPSGASVYDISNFSDISLLCQIDTPDIVRSTLLNDDILYMVGDINGLTVYEISDLDDPTLLNQYFPEFNWCDIDLVAENLILTGRSRGVQTIDLTEEDDLEIISSIGSVGKIDRVYVHADIAYVIGENNKIRSVDVSNPVSPEILCELILGNNSNGSLTDLAASGDYAFISTENMGMRVVNISNPSNLIEVSSTSYNGIQNTIDISGNYAFVGGDNLQNYDVSDPLNPSLVFSTHEGYYQDILIRDQYLYYTDGGQNIYVLDISDPDYLSLDPSSSCPLQENAFRLSIGQGVHPLGSDELLLASSNTNIFPIVTLSDPEYPVLLTEHNCPGRTFEVNGINEFLFTASYTQGLKIFNYTDPLNNVRQVGYYDSDFYATSIAFSQDYVLLGDTYSLIILNCQDALGIENDYMKITPDIFAISNTYPNPFNPTLNVEVALPETARLNVSVYNINGQMVGQISNGVVNAGTHNLTFDGSDLSSGVYFIQAKIPGYSIQTKKVVLMK